MERLKNIFAGVFAVLIFSMLGWSGQAADEAVGTVVKESLSFDGMERTYEYYVPTSYDGSEPVPLLFSFHGLGSSAEGQRSLTDFVRIAEEEGFIAVFPNATALVDDGSVELPALPNAHIQWNDGRKNSLQNYHGIDDVGFVSELIERFIEAFNIDERRIYATGMSNGAMFSQRLAIELSDRLAAVASVTGGLPSEEFGLKTPKRPIPVIFIMGTNDPIIPYDAVMPGTLAYWQHHNGTDAEPVRETLPKVVEDDPTVIHKEVYANGKSGSEIVVYRVEEGGHTWPGGPQYAPEQVIGKASQQMHASEVIWEHFKQYALEVEDEEEPPSRLKRVEIEVDGLKRSFEYYVPSSYDGSRAAPLLLSFHGAGSSGAGQNVLSRFDQIAEREGFIAVFPDSTAIKDGQVIEPEDSAFDPDSSIDRSWKIEHDIVDDVAFAEAVLDYFERNYKIDADRVYATGMSSGALFSSHLAVMLPDRIAAIGLVAGQMTSATAAMAAKIPKTVVMVMGEEDPLYHARPSHILSNEETIDYWLNANRMTSGPEVSYLPQTADGDPTRIKRTAYSGGWNGTEVIYYLVEGGGHTWPGGPQYLPVEAIGRTSQHMNASEVIWEDLKAHTLGEAVDNNDNDDDDKKDPPQEDPVGGDGKDGGKGADKPKQVNGKSDGGNKKAAAAGDRDGKGLPKTAANFYTFLLIGALLIAPAAALIYLRKRRLME